MTNKQRSIVLFEQREVRRTWDESRDKWFFSIVDIIAVLTSSENPQVYWRVLKKRLLDEGANETVTNCNGLKMKAADGKMRETDVGDTETILRLIQSIPSPKAEPFKQWLAKVGYERLKEIEDPEIAIQRGGEYYRKKGYSEEWIAQRLRTIEIRHELTNEWKNRGVQKPEYAILTDDITEAWAGMKTHDYKRFKNLKSQNLRDHMSNLELILNTLAEASTTEIARKQDVKGLAENRRAAKQGGQIAGSARKQIEAQTGAPIVTRVNYLPKKKTTKKLK
ncbi:MAG: BRO family protein [bacterium]|nr:BRO family protein [bacterium]